MAVPLAAELWVVMPVYNERAAISTVVREWSAAVGAADPAAVLCVVDDGSSDGTAEELAGLRRDLPELRVLWQPNRGHGQACLAGYRAALAAGARWVLQVDSDGQCDPRHFPAMWRARDAGPAVLGHRIRREDGLARLVISRLLALVVGAATGGWIPDPNTPYRLMRADVLGPAVVGIPPDVHLANVLLAVRLRVRCDITWVEVGFRRRIRPARLRPGYFAVQAVRLLRDLRRHRRSDGSGRRR